MGGSISVNPSEITMSNPLGATIEEMVREHKVMIFSKTQCPYCTMAKKVFEEIGQTFKVVELDHHSQGKEMQNILGQMTGATTVPRVFVNGKCIGGGTETRQLHKEGKLQKLLQSS